MSGSDLQHRLDGALREIEQLRAENERLRTLLALAQRTQTILDARKLGPSTRGRELPCFGRREGRARAPFVLRPRRRLRGSLGKRIHRQDRLRARDCRRLGPSGAKELSAVKRRGDRAAPARPAVDRCLPATHRRHLLAPYLRPRRQDLAARRARAPRGLRGAWRAGGAGAKPLRIGRPRLGLLRRSCRRLGRPPTRRPATPRGADAAWGARPGKLRPALPQPGLVTCEGVRQPDRAAAPRSLPR